MKTQSLLAGDILLFKGNSLLSKLIKMSTKSEYSHVAIVLDPKNNVGIEAILKGVRAFDLRKLDINDVDIFRIKEELLLKVCFDKTTSFLVDKLGSKYDKLGVIWLGCLKLFSFCIGGVLKPHNKFQKSKDYFCSELTYLAFAEGDIDIVPEVESSDITSPGDISRSSVIIKLDKSPEI